MVTPIEEIEQLAKQAIDDAIGNLPDSKVIDRNVVVDAFLDLRLELLAIELAEVDKPEAELV